MLEYELTFSNAGAERAEEGWYVRVYLSENRDLDAADVLVDQWVARRALEPGGSDLYLRGFKIPGTVVPGEYHLVSEMDATGAIEEPVEDNNAAASDRRTRISAPADGL